jgi:hypothetical protein
MIFIVIKIKFDIDINNDELLIITWEHHKKENGVMILVIISQFQFYGWGCPKKQKKLNLDVRTIFAGFHAKHRWRCLDQGKIWSRAFRYKA